MICCIDPGTAHCGIVMMDESHIRMATTHTTKPGKDESTEDCYRRCKELVSAIERDVSEGYSRGLFVDTVVIEGYVDITPYRGYKNRWQTPMLVGVLLATLEPKFELHIQEAQKVMTAYAAYKAAWADGKHLVRGDELLTNDHTRSAAMHGIYYYASLKRKKAIGRNQNVR